MTRPAGIVPATAADAALLAALHAACFDSPGQRPWDSIAMAQFIAGPGTVCLIGVAGGEDPTPAGFLIARTAAEEAELLTIGVLGPYRRCGLGRTLLRSAAESLRASGVSQLFLEVDEQNAGALALYRGFGAVTVGHRPGYYEGGADATILNLALSALHSDDAPDRG